MGQAKGITALIFFSFFIFISIAVGVGIIMDAGTMGYDAEIGVAILIETSLLFSTGLLIPGILCVLEKQYDTAKWFYGLIPTTLLWFLIYTIIVAVLAPTAFMSNFLEFLGLGIGGAVVLAIISLCMGYLRY